MIYNRQRQQIGLPPVSRLKTVFDDLMSPYLHLQGTTPAFEFPYTDLPPQVHFVGPMLPPMPANWQPPAWWGELGRHEHGTGVGEPAFQDRAQLPEVEELLLRAGRWLAVAHHR